MTLRTNSLEGFFEAKPREAKPKEAKPRRIADWLENNYSNKSTKDAFYLSLKLWIKCVYGKDYVTDYFGVNVGKDSETVKRNVEKRINEIEEGIERYLSDLNNRNFTDDYKKFINWARSEGYSNLYIIKISGKAKIFFPKQDPRCKISDEDWGSIKRNLLPKSTRPSTQDDILTKEQLKKVIQHLSIHGKALALFLLSTGSRIGETIQLTINDIKLDSDPPEVNIREKYTKAQVGGRVMWFSEEARDAIREWHKARLFKKKPNSSEDYDKNLVFNIRKGHFNFIWNRALKRADGGQDPPVLAKRDPSTKRRIHVFHVHTIRKFFRTHMGLAGVPDFVVHGWMGHKKYLAESYDKLGKGRMAEIYKDHMKEVTVYEVGIDETARAKYKETIERAEKLAEQTIEDRVFVDMIGGQLDAFVGLSDEEKEALGVNEKKELIIYKVARLKVELVELVSAREQSIKEIDKTLKFKLTTK